MSKVNGVRLLWVVVIFLMMHLAIIVWGLVKTRQQSQGLENLQLYPVWLVSVIVFQIDI